MTLDRLVCLDSAETLIDGVSALVFELSAYEAGKPPTEIRMFSAGVTDTTKGKFLFDAHSADSVMRRFAEHGKDRLPFDYGHGMVSFAGDQRAAGWFVPEVRAGELWATDIQWTPRAVTEMSAREWRFYSPAFKAMWPEDTAEPAVIVELINCALTNLPATKGQKPIVASETHETERETMQPILKLLGVAGENEAHTAVTQLLSLQTSVASLLKAHEVDSVAALGSLVATSQKAVKDMQDERTKEKRTAAIAALSQDGRLPPAQHEFAASLSDAQFERYVAGLGAAQVKTPGSVTPMSSGSDPSARAPHTPASITLTAEELELCSMFGHDTDEMKQVKAELLSGSNPRMFTPKAKRLAR